MYRNYMFLHTGARAVGGKRNLVLRTGSSDVADFFCAVREAYRVGVSIRAMTHRGRGVQGLPDWLIYRR